MGRARAEVLVFSLARRERDVWMMWPARVAALMAAQVMSELEKQSGRSVPLKMIVAAIPKTMLETHVNEQLAALADLRVSLG